MGDTRVSEQEVDLAWNGIRVLSGLIAVIAVVLMLVLMKLQPHQPTVAGPVPSLNSDRAPISNENADFQHTSLQGRVQERSTINAMLHD